MKLLSLKSVLLRYVGAVVLLSLAGLAANPSAPAIIVIAAFVCVKYLLYDGIVSVLGSKLPGFKAHPWLLGGYGLAVAGDMLFVYSGSGGGTDDGFALLGTLQVTPWVLVAAGVAMAIATARNRRR
jgi:hypothetical protein